MTIIFCKIFKIHLFLKEINLRPLFLNHSLFTNLHIINIDFFLSLHISILVYYILVY